MTIKIASPLARQLDAVFEPVEGLDLAFNPAELRNAKGEWTKDETRSWLKSHPVSSKNIVDMWDQGTKGEHDAGVVWYPHAHMLATALGKRYGVSTQEAAGLLATYSPQTAWGKNVREAAEALREKRALGGPGEKIWWHHDATTRNTVEEREGVMAPNVTKQRAQRIMEGQDPEEVFAGGRNKNGSLKPNSLKIRAFFDLIANGVNNPDHPETVIDRHAAGVARGVRMTDEDYNVDGPSSSLSKFTVYTDAYAKAAAEISKREGRTIPPEAVQAATWLTRQRLNGALDTQVGKTRKALGDQDTDAISNYIAQYLPEATTSLPKVGYADLSVSVAEEFDPALGGHTHLLTKPDDDTTVRRIAVVLIYSGDPKEQTRLIARMLAPFGVSKEAVDIARGLANSGTNHRPNAKLAEHGAKTTGLVKATRDADLYYRAAYLANAAQRIDRALDAGKTQREALRAERVYFQAHEDARRGRLRSAAQVQAAQGLFGDELGWYLNPLLKNDPECIAANGHNFDANEGTVIGLPGSVHRNCGCYAGPPHEGARLVNEVMSNLYTLKKSKPKFKVKGA